MATWHNESERRPASTNDLDRGLNEGMRGLRAAEEAEAKHSWRRAFIDGSTTK